MSGRVALETGPGVEMPADGLVEAAPPLEHRAIGGFLWLFAGNGARSVLKIAVLAVLGRLLVPQDFGLVAAAGMVLWFALICSTLGVGPALVQRRTVEPAHVATAVTLSAAFGVAMAALVYLSAPLLAEALRLDGLVPVLRAFALVFPLTAIASPAEALLQRELRFRSIAAAELVSYLVGYGGIGVPMALFGFGVWSLVGAEYTKSIIKTGWFLWLAPRTLRLGFDRRAGRDLLGFGSGFTITGLSNYLAFEADNFVVARSLGAMALGLYSRAFELMLVPAVAIGIILEKVLLATMARVQDDPERLRRAYRRTTAALAMAVLPASVVTAVLAPEIVRVLLGPQWGGAVAPLQVLAVAMYFRVGYMVGQSVAAAAGAVYGAAWRNFLYAGLVALGAFAGRSWGLPGVAAGVTVAVAANFAMVYQLARRLTQLRIRDFVGVHAPALGIAVLLGAESLAVAMALRVRGAPAALTLAAAAAIMGLTMLLMLRLAAADRLGGDAHWLVEVTAGRLPSPVRPMVRRLLGLAA